MNRSPVKPLATLCLLALLSTSCGNGDEGAAGDSVEISFSWWGSQARNEATEQIIAAYEEQNPDVTVQAEYRDWGAYWDTLATRAAGGDAPDVMQMDLEFFREYADRGVLMDITDVDTSGMTDDLLQQGRVNEGQYGIPTGFASVAMIVNRDALDEAGLDMPDDTTWTWDDFTELASAVQGQTEAYGTGAPFEPFSGVQVWLRQNGKEVTDSNGGLAISAVDLTEYFEFIESLTEADALPPASAVEEDRTQSTEQIMIATGSAAMAFSWSNLFPALSEVAPGDLEILRYPSYTGSASDNGLWHRVSMFLSASADTEHPEEVQDFIEFFTTSEEAALYNLADRGLPADEDARNAALGEMSGDQEAVAEFLADIEDEVQPPAPVPPPGYATVADTMHRYQFEVISGSVSPEEAGEAAYAEIQSNLQ